MASVPKLQHRNNARRYFAQFAYPITPQEAIFWQSPYSPNRLAIQPSSHSKLRKQRFLISQPKWLVAKKVAKILSRLPTIQAIFVTGALSMDNCPADDDIDFMIVTSPHTLWLTRAFVVLYLSFMGLRRPPSLPEHSSPRVKDKICDNLYLDQSHLAIQPSSHTALYLAHEILQAKCLFDRGAIQYQFLSQNPWVKRYLPVAYKQTLSSVRPHVMLNRNEASRFNPLFKTLNSLFFFIQYLYMKPKLTRERVGVGFAFFHPRQSI